MRNLPFMLMAIVLLSINIAWGEMDSSGKHNSTARTYTIVSSEDRSMKAMTENLSDYTLAELDALPLNIRKEYRIVVPSDITKDELKETLKYLVGVETKANPDIDAIMVFAYDRKEDVDSFYTYGKLEWSPGGDWGGVTPEIAINNDRSSYKYFIDIKDKVGKKNNADRPTKEEFAIYDTLEKALWDDPNTDEEIVISNVAKKLEISTKTLNAIYIKVFAYKMQ